MANHLLVGRRKQSGFSPPATSRPVSTIESRPALTPLGHSLFLAPLAMEAQTS